MDYFFFFGGGGGGGGVISIHFRALSLGQGTESDFIKGSQNFKYFLVVCLIFIFGKLITVAVYCFGREMKSPGGSCVPLCNLLKNSLFNVAHLKQST